MSKLSKTAQNARNALIADAAISFARDRLATQFPGVKPRRRRPGAKALLFGGAVAVAGVAVLLKRDKVVALLPGHRDEPAPPPSSSYTPPPVSNYDASGPVANTATSVPVPPAYESPAIDEAAEEAAAAAEAANIGGPVSDYEGPQGETASPDEAPLAEAGEGAAEGDEQADAELRDAAEGADPPDDSDGNTWSGRSAD